MKRDSATGICPITHQKPVRDNCFDCYAMLEVVTRWTPDRKMVAGFTVECDPLTINKKLLSGQGATKAN